MGESSTGKKGGKKVGRGLRSPAHARYVNEGRYQTNKAKKLRKHLKKCGKDITARRALQRLGR